MSLTNWVSIFVGVISAATAGTYELVKYTKSVAEENLWKDRANEFSKKLKEAGNNWKKVVSIITGEENENSVFKLREDGTFTRPEEAKKILMEWCSDSSITNKKYNDDDLEKSVCQFKK